MTVQARPNMTSLRRRQILTFALPLAATATLGGRASAADDTKTLLDSIAKARKGLRSLSAPFAQTRTVGLLAEEVKSKGALDVVLPGSLRWELFAPDDVVYWLTRDGVFYRAGRASKAVRAPSTGGFHALLGDLVAFVGGDVAALLPRYEMTAKSEADGSVSLTATPKDEALRKALKRLSMKTNAERWGIASVSIEEPSGDASSIVFGPNQRDPAIDPAKLKPPV